MSYQNKQESIKKLKTLISELRGKEITKAIGILEPLSWKNEDEEDPILDNPKLPFRQLKSLNFWINGEEGLRFITTQSEDEFGLYLEKIPNEKVIEQANYQLDLTSILQGRILSIEIEMDAIDIFKVKISFTSNEVLIVAAEVEPGVDEICIRRCDESILLFEEPEKFNDIKFNEYFSFKL
jgi:hypothetical protein